MKYTIFTVIALATLMAACAPLSPSQQVVVDNQAERGISCASQGECAMRWARAVQWVQSNADYPVETQTPTLVVTTQPPVYSARPGITIAMEPQGYGYTRIDFAAGCGFFIPICDPSASTLRARFAAYVMDDSVQ